MKMELKIVDGKIQVDLAELFYLLDEAQEDEWDAAEFMRKLAWTNRIRAEVITLLKEEYSAPCYNSSIHEDRKELLRAMKEQEIQYYANKLASIIETNRRWERDYWKLYHATSDSFGRAWVESRNFPPPTDDIDFDFRRELEHILEKDMSQHMAWMKKQEG